MTLTEHLNSSIQPKRVDESLVLSAIVCASCIAYAAGPVLNTDFMKSVGSGLGALLSGIGGMFGGLNFGGVGSKDKIKELLKKDTDDLTGKEKDILRKAADNPKLQKELSTNELKKLNKAIGKSDSDAEEIDDEELKELHALLKKKPGDLNPREKAKLKEYAKKYDLSQELSNSELKNLEEAGISLSGKEDEPKEPKEDEPKEPKDNPDITDGLLAIAAAANKNEEDPDKKAENDKLIDILIASCYDENGDPVPFEQREARMKDIVGEDKWEEFKKDLEQKQKSVSEDDFKEALEKANKDLTPEEAQKMIDDQKKRAKSVNAKIKDETDDEPKKDDDEKDEDGNIVKDEEVTDPKTGKKIKVKTHTGPRGGKFYYPDGKPKTPEHKVYVQEDNYCKLTKYLSESFNK